MGNEKKKSSLSWATPYLDRDADSGHCGLIGKEVFALGGSRPGFLLARGIRG